MIWGYCSLSYLLQKYIFKIISILLLLFKSDDNVMSVVRYLIHKKNLYMYTFQINNAHEPQLLLVGAG
jgi:hypothetical protein